MQQTTTDIWTDRFVEPTLPNLLDRYQDSIQSVLEDARSLLSADGTIAETVSWMAAPFHWCVVYEAPGVADPLWYLVPAEETPRVVIRVGTEPAKALLKKRISRASRDALKHAYEVGGTRWVDLELGSQAQLKELKIFVRTIADELTV